jgi:hypothetical protein
MAKDQPPTPIVRKTPNGLFPVSGFDAEEIDTFPMGQEFDLKPRARRSGALHRTYWKTLGGVIAATGMYPTTRKLHKELKRDLGYVDTVRGLDGREHEVVESTAFNEMKTDAEFRPYFDAAIARLSEVCGYDVLEWLDQ